MNTLEKAIDNIARIRERRFTETQWWSRFFQTMIIVLICAVIAALIIVGTTAIRADANGPTRHAMSHKQPGPKPYRHAHMALYKAKKYVKHHKHKAHIMCTSWGKDTPYQQFPSVNFTCGKQVFQVSSNMLECGGIAALGAWGGGPEGAAAAFGGCEFSKAMSWWQKKVGRMFRLGPNGRMIRR